MRRGHSWHLIDSDARTNFDQPFYKIDACPKCRCERLTINESGRWRTFYRRDSEAKFKAPPRPECAVELCAEKPKRPRGRPPKQRIAPV